MKRTLIALLLYTEVISQSFANISDSNFLDIQKTNRSSEYIFESYPNQELISIKVLGAVKHAGLYHVPSDINLSTVIALAGGTTTDADTENIIVANDIKTDQVISSKKIDLVDSITHNEKDKIFSNDIVFVKSKSSLISADTMKSVSIVSILLSAILTSVLIKEKTAK
jgi:DNA uptake protein ComE-like DNA-binding protein